MSSEITIRKENQNIWLKRVDRRLRAVHKLGKWGWWIWIMMQLSDWPFIGRLFTHLARLPVAPYKGATVLATVKTYISPKAQIHCPNLTLGPKCFIDDFVTIYGEEGSVVLGKRVHLYRGTIIEVGDGGKVVIGDHIHVHPDCKFNGYIGQIRIGQNVMIAAGCCFVPYQHELTDINAPMTKQGLTSKGDIIIEDDVWLGMGVKVMDGVRIGRGAVIGANAVVTKDIPAYSIAVGVPARVIGQRNKPDSTIADDQKS